MRIEKGKDVAIRKCQHEVYAQRGGDYAHHPRLRTMANEQQRKIAE
jgi:hypothetical protein